MARLAAAEPVATAIEDASQAAALRVWALLAPLGSLPSGAMVGPTSRAWYEELRLAPVVADALRAGGLDEAAAMVGRGARARAARPAAAVLDHGACCDAATAPRRRVALASGRAPVPARERVGRCRVVPRRVARRLLVWVERLERASAADGVAPARSGAAVRRLAAAADGAAYRVDRLREGLGGGVAPASGPKPSGPKASSAAGSGGTTAKTPKSSRGT